MEIVKSIYHKNKDQISNRLLLTNYRKSHLNIILELQRIKTNSKGIHKKITKITFKEDPMCLPQSELNTMNKNEQLQWPQATQSTQLHPQTP